MKTVKLEFRCREGLEMQMKNQYRTLQCSNALTGNSFEQLELVELPPPPLSGARRPKQGEAHDSQRQRGDYRVL